MEYSDAPQLVQDFLTYKLIIQGRSPLTIFQYYHDLRTLYRFILKQHNAEKYKNIELCDISFSEVSDDIIEKLTSQEIFKFLVYESDNKNGNSSRARKLSAIRSFYKYLTKVKGFSHNPTENIESPKLAKKLPKYLTLDESIALLNSIEGKYKERDFAIITIFLNCGLRVSELVGININDIDTAITEMHVTGKGSKERMIYLNESCKSAIERYLKFRPTDPKEKDKNALFISRNRNRISIKTVQWLIYKHLKGAQFENKHLSVHKLRHTAATLMYTYGNADVRVIKDILGHEDVSTTQIYTHVSNRQIKSVMMNNPLNKKKKE